MFFRGKYCGGEGSEQFLRHIDDSLSMLCPTAERPNITMLYHPDGDSFKEGFIWGSGFWIQNSYGFVTGAAPFLSKPWAKVLQNSLDLHWDNMGDGKRIGMHNQLPSETHCYNLRAPDGSLGDCADGQGSVYKQGDGNVDEYDWFYEAAAAGLNMQADLLLAAHDDRKAREYMPKMLRTVNFIEGARDPENGLFLVGPACNLLAPSYGAFLNPETGEIEKCYLTGVSITYAAALARLREVALLIGDEALAGDFAEKRRITLQSLPKLLTDEGYFLKFMEKDGTPHGLYGRETYGYLDGVCNIDAIAFGVADDALSAKIYGKIASVKGIRPFDFLCANYPGLDDNLPAYRGQPSPFGAGNWVDGGCWGTVEGRAMLAYARLGKFGDAFRSAERNMKWSEDYRQDEPYSQWGENTHNPWAKETEAGRYDGDTRQTGVMIDNFAVPACLLRGLLGIEYAADAILLSPSLPPEIETYAQYLPVRFGAKSLFVTVKNAPEKRVFKLCYDALPDSAEVVLDLRDGGCGISEHICAPETFDERGYESGDAERNAIYKKMVQKYQSLSENASCEYALFLKDAILAFIASAERRSLPFDKEHFRPMTDKKKAEILSIYDESALNVYRGLGKHVCFD